MRAELAFSVSDLAQTRFAVSPMWEVGTSYRLLASGSASLVHRPWTEQVRPRLAAAGLDRGRLAELIPPSGYVPDFLNPAPTGPAPSLAEELAGIRATPAARVRRDLDRLRQEQGGLGPRTRSLYADPQARLARVAEEIETYWELALAPYWARIRAVLDADVFHRARQSAEHGAGRLFNDLHPSVSWGDDALRLSRRHRPLSRGTAGAGLLLIPSVFTGPVPFTRSAPLTRRNSPIRRAAPARCGSRGPPAGPRPWRPYSAAPGPGCWPNWKPRPPPPNWPAERGSRPPVCPSTSPRCAPRAWSAPTGRAAPCSTPGPPSPSPSSAGSRRPVLEGTAELLVQDGQPPPVLVLVDLPGGETPPEDRDR